MIRVMAHTPLSLISLSALSLTLACGCASTNPRARSADNESHERTQVEQDWFAQSQSHENAHDHGLNSHEGYENDRDELVIGVKYNDEFVPAYPTPITRYSIDEIRAELESMYDQDQRLVQSALGQHAIDDLTPAQIRAIDYAHAQRLQEIVDHIGWPTRELVGLKATQAAYMVIQHAGDDIEFQNRCLALMVDLVEEGELPASYVALLTDRIRVFQHKPQVFGTQMMMAKNELGLLVPTPTVPIEDPSQLDNRRKLMGMPPHREFVSAIAIAYEASKVEAGSAFANVPTFDD